MSSLPPKAVSVHQDGTDDGFVVLPGWQSEATPAGDTRIVVSVPSDRLAETAFALIRALSPPLSFLYRQFTDRQAPRPNGSKSRDFVALELAPERVVDALSAAQKLLVHDARAEMWIRGRLGEQLIVDRDGLLFCYPDDPAFRDALERASVPPDDTVTMSERDYVKHYFVAEADDEERMLRRSLNLTEVPTR